MTIEEATEARYALEARIYRELVEFEKITGARIQDIKLTTATAADWATGKEIAHEHTVRVEVTL